ncbi:hypothetical protein ANCCEY_00575 [Ancylostoma ceylanicum]|uniref:DRBM domain-containing protein n=1 Tax=Ancylostoma ceylanicum TaxID=53326 RepID=A0A0D6M9Y9_9BILA|nr:hypothetical protein ANCCEY_00575 [Ancylostoma ceylanicum]
MMLVPSRSIHPQPWCGQHQTTSDVSSRNVYNYSNQEDKEKTPMCRIAELARFHKIFEGSGASIKKAQQAAAAAALAGTSLAMPPEKKRKKGGRPLIGPMPPVNQLFAVVSPTSRTGPVYPVQPPGERICMVSVAIGPGRVFTGIGSTFAQAKSNAAAQLNSNNLKFLQIFA